MSSRSRLLRNRPPRLSVRFLPFRFRLDHALRGLPLCGFRSLLRVWSVWPSHPRFDRAPTRDAAMSSIGQVVNKASQRRSGGHVSPFPHSSQSCHGRSGSPKAVSNDFRTTRLSLTGSLISSSFRRWYSIILRTCSSVRSTVTAQFSGAVIGLSTSPQLTSKAALQRCDREPQTVARGFACRTLQKVLMREAQALILVDAHCAWRSFTAFLAAEFASPVLYQSA